MRYLRNPNRPQLLRVLGLLALIAVITVVAGVATAGPKRTPAPKPPSGSSTAYKRVVASQVRMMKRAEAGLRKIARVSARKKKTQQSIVLAGAADGKYLYWPRITIDVRSFYSDEGFGYRYEIVRTNRDTGKDEVLLSKKGAYAMGVFARGGRVAFQTLRITGSGERSLLRSTIYTAAHGDAALSAPVVEKLKIGNTDEFCADMQNLSGLSADGELIITELHGTCAGGEQQDLSAEMRLWKSDGSKQDLGPAAADAIFGGDALFGGTSARLAGGKLVVQSPNGPATAVRDVAGGTSANLWSPSAKTFDVAADGTVALIGSAPPSEISGPPGSKSKPPKPKYPFVLFPSGDADQPKLIAASKVRTEALQFCGDRLFVVVGGPALGGLLGDASQEAEADSIFQTFPQFGLRDHEILIYDLQGTLVRSAAKVEMKGLAAIGCNGPNLVLGVIHGETVRATEVTP